MRSIALHTGCRPGLNHVVQVLRKAALDLFASLRLRWRDSADGNVTPTHKNFADWRISFEEVLASGKECADFLQHDGGGLDVSCNISQSSVRSRPMPNSLRP